jgi:purine-binding chemotaxis protein CheW
MPLNEQALRELAASISARKKTAQASRSVPIDWNIVHRRLTESSARLAWVDELTEEALQQAWTHRAAQMAQTLQEQEQGEQLEVAVIQLGREQYGLEVQYIFDIRLEENITRVPRVPDWVAGVVNLRGQILSVVDLQRYLDLPAAEKTPEAGPRHLLLVQTPQMELALLVDEVLSIQNLPVSRIQEAASVVRGLPAEYVQGVYIENGNGGNKVASSKSKENTSLLVILNLSALLADKRLIVQEEIV